MSVKWNANSLIQDLNSGCHVHFLKTITITPRRQFKYYGFQLHTVQECIFNCFKQVNTSYFIFHLAYAEGKDPPLNECPAYDTKQSDGAAQIMLELWGMRSIPSLLSIPGSLSLGVVAPDKVLSKGQIELKGGLILNWIVWNRTVLTFNSV